MHPPAANDNSSQTPSFAYNTFPLLWDSSHFCLLSCAEEGTAQMLHCAKASQQRVCNLAEQITAG